MSLITDALGHRPLFFAKHLSVLIFGSRAKSVAMISGVPNPDFVELANFLIRRAGASARSFFEGVTRVQPGTLVEFSAPDRYVSRRWWRPDFSPIKLGDDELVTALSSAFDRSVKAILARHPNAAAHLSAGLDSSLSVSLASKQIPKGRKLIAFCGSPSYSVSLPGYGNIGDEYPLASRTAAMLGNVLLRKVIARDADWIAVGDLFSRASGMPYANQANLGWVAATYSAAGKIGASALIESNLGNVTLSWCGEALVPTLIRRGRFRELLDYIRRIRSSTNGTGLMIIPKGLFEFFPHWIADPIAAVMRVPDASTEAFLRRNHPAVRMVRKEVVAAARWMRLNRSSRSPKDRLFYLHWADVGSHMSAMKEIFGIELCDPFASKRLIELTLKIEDPRYFFDGFGRGFARQLLKGHVPKEVADGQITWQQGLDWRAGAIKMLDTARRDLEYAETHPKLSELLDIPRLKCEIQTWKRCGTESLIARARASNAMRSIAAIRFVRWIAELSG